MTEEKFQIPEGLQTLSATYNTYRLRHQGQKLTSDEVNTIFKAIGLPTHGVFRKHAIENKLLFKYGVARSCYFYFPKESVHWKVIDRAIADSRKEMSNAKKIQRTATSKMSINDAIALLKEHGYKIMKPTYVEV